MKQEKARELAQRFGVRMCDENGMTHGEELYCLGLDDIIAMKEALTKQEQGEPVGEILLINGDYKEVSWRNGKLPPVGAKFYTAPQQRKPLTDEQIRSMEFDHIRRRDFARAIEAAHGIKE